MIQSERIRTLNSGGIMMDKPHVLYWMQSAQRAECNHALEYAILQANAFRKPLITFFGVTDRFPEGNERHYRFMLEGLLETKAELGKRNIRMVIGRVSPEKGALALAGSAAMVVTDRGYLRVEREWRETLAARAPCGVVQVETNVIVPVETASGKEEYTAATFRPRINRLLDFFTQAPEEGRVLMPPPDTALPCEPPDISDVDAELKRLDLDRSVSAVQKKGGPGEAKRLLRAFIADKLEKYPVLKSDPGEDVCSGLSPYLHFGQISPLYIYESLRAAPKGPREAFLEELIVRRELSMNYAFYNENYDAYGSLPAWAQRTLDKHRGDLRPYLYSLEALENARTHDPYWNAAQQEMVLSGQMHGYMRMYWGKKLLEWGETPEEAFRTALYLNNRYSLDGRDPNGFAGIAWCFGKHDRPWGEREVFGNVRYMNAKGLERKFKMKKYLEKVQAMGGAIR